MELRTYQKECLSAIKGAWEGRGLKRILVSMATGGGKTSCFAHIPHYLKLNKRMLILAHREELLDQAASHIQDINPKLSVGIEQASRRAGDADVVIASVQSLQNGRLASMNPDEFQFIVQDEAHHARVFRKQNNNTSYQNIFEHFKVMEDGPKLLGVTATPNRADGAGLGTLFEDVVYHCGIEELIRQGWLVPIKAYSIQSECDISEVKKSMGDFVISQLSQAVNQVNRNDLVVKCYKEFLQGRQALVFCVDVQHAEDVTKKFQSYGIDARCVFGHTKSGERDAIMQGFKDGQFPVLANVGVVTEGVDSPSCSGIIMARPTQSEVFFAQALGRGTRLYPDASKPLHVQTITDNTKKDLVVIDICDNAGKHSLVTVPKLFGLPAKTEMKGERPDEVVKDLQDALLQVNRNEQGRHVTQEEVRKMARIVNLFAGAENLVRRKSQFNWLEPTKGNYMLVLNDKLTTRATQDLLGKWRAWLDNGKQKVSLYEGHDLKDMCQRTDAFIEKEFDDIVMVGNVRVSRLNVIKKNSAWRRQPASDKQKNILRMKQIPFDSDISKGEAANLLTLAFSVR